MRSQFFFGVGKDHMLFKGAERKSVASNRFKREEIQRKSTTEAEGIINLPQTLTVGSDKFPLDTTKIL